ncbi:MAG: hypothetical protein ACRDT8_24610 [Micromonosporaceae bacterium]
MTAQRPPRRVRVTSPRARAGRRRATTITREIDAQTQIGEVYMRSLIRAQLRLALLVLSAVGLLLAGLPLLFATAPELPQLQLIGLPLPWLLLGVLVHPTLVGAAWFYCRQAERTEREFADLVEPKSSPAPAEQRQP